MKSYLFLDDNVYSPEEQENVFGNEVLITKKQHYEVWFTNKKTGKKGYVVYPSLFAENTKENKEKIKEFKAKLKSAKTLKKEAYKLLKTVQLAGF